MAMGIWRPFAGCSWKKSEMKIFNIQRYCVNDGPGIRTTVFLKGCPLNCAWCHNPESKRLQDEIAYDPAKCLGCGRCAEACDCGCHAMQNGLHAFLRKGCLACGRCAEVCPGEALTRFGQERDAESILKDVLRDEAFYRHSGGGLTLSGGEPFFQPEAALQLLRKAKEAGLHTCVETCGYASWEILRQALPLVDIFLYDVKATADDVHRKYTGVSNARILQNLRRLDGEGGVTRLRCPIIPGVNDTPEHFAGVARLANGLSHVEMIEVEPYHPLGQHKLATLGREPSMADTPFPGKEEAEQYVREIAAQTNIFVRQA